ncbi:MAG: hypothetical protein JWM64_1114 [Frankiales bacterium]|nr:hypothetical protein [Frankiales bacterium]
MEPPQPGYPGAVAEFEEIIDQGLGLTPLPVLLQQVQDAAGDPLLLAGIAAQMRRRHMTLLEIGELIGMTRTDVYVLLQHAPD